MTYQISLVSYYLSNIFVIIEKNECALDKVPLNAKNNIHALYKHDNDCDFTWKTVITLIVNTLHNIYIPNNLHDKYDSNFYDDRHIEGYIIYFLTFVGQILKKIEHPNLFTEWKINID